MINLLFRRQNARRLSVGRQKQVVRRLDHHRARYRNKSRVNIVIVEEFRDHLNRWFEGHEAAYTLSWYDLIPSKPRTPRSCTKTRLDSNDLGEQHPTYVGRFSWTCPSPSRTRVAVRTSVSSFAFLELGSRSLTRLRAVTLRVSLPRAGITLS